MKCESCDIEIAVLPLWREDRYFCCSGCADGGPCICSYTDDPARLGKDSGAEPVRMEDLLDRYDRELDQSSRANRDHRA